MSQREEPRIVLRDPAGLADRTVQHPGQPGQYLDERGSWEQADQSANWRRVGDADLRVYDLIEPTTGCGRRSWGTRGIAAAAPGR